MQQVKVIAVGKIKEKYLQQGIEEYIKRLRPYLRLQLIEVKEEQAPEGLSKAERDKVKELEGARLFEQVCADDVVIALAIEGKQMSSEVFARQLSDWALHGQSQVAFLIGGSLGLSEGVLARADLCLSFSAMTFPHQLMRLILLEQIYRALKIQRGEPYHK